MMNELYNPKLIQNAKSLRKGMTKEERKLWYTFLRYLPVKFVRQKALGFYIADFYCAEARLAIELDGSQHFEEAGERRDLIRDAFFSAHGIRVVRYSNYDIAMHYDVVKADILKQLGLD